MNRKHAQRLLREAAHNPSTLIQKAKFWKLAFWPHYLRHCDTLLFDEPQEGFTFTQYGPTLAQKIDETAPGANGADLMLLAHSYLGGAYRRIDDYESAERSFLAAIPYKESASPKALAEHLRRIAYLRIFQKDPECFPSIEEAIAIHKKGNLVTRHALGECLVCRGHAYFVFGQQGKSLDDWTASLNHLSLKIDPRAWYSALHNLAGWAVEYGTEEQLTIAYRNLKPALSLLNTFYGRQFAKLKLRWLIAVIDSRRGNHGRAETVYLEVRDGLAKLNLGYELGMLSIDLAMLYLSQGRHREVRELARETASLFHRIGVDAKAREALDLWHQSEEISEELLKNVRSLFLQHTRPIPVAA